MGSNFDELDTIFELIIAVVFMSFGIFATSLMVQRMAAKVEVVENRDKIEISRTAYVDDDPFYFTGYQAYMFAWHMDEMSYVPLSYVGGNLTADYSTLPDGNIRSNIKIEQVNPKTITLGLLDENGDIRSQFITWRNQRITGGGIGETEASVKSAIASVVNRNSTNLNKLYRGMYDQPGGGHVMFHLELTDDYVANTENVSVFGSSTILERRKVFRWVLAPTYH